MPFKDVEVRVLSPTPRRPDRYRGFRIENGRLRERPLSRSRLSATRLRPASGEQVRGHCLGRLSVHAFDDMRISIERDHHAAVS